jgi:hypothetical protein
VGLLTNVWNCGWLRTLNTLPRVGEIVNLKSNDYEIKLIEYCPDIEKIYFYVIETDINQCRKSVFGGARPI